MYATLILRKKYQTESCCVIFRTMDSSAKMISDSHVHLLTILNRHIVLLDALGLILYNLFKSKNYELANLQDSKL